MRKEEMRTEIERWVERTIELKERSEEIPISEVLIQEYYLKLDIEAILHEGLRREK